MRRREERRNPHNLQELTGHTAKGLGLQPILLHMHMFQPFLNLPHHLLLEQVTSLTLGKGRQQRDRIFVAAGNTVCSSCVQCPRALGKQAAMLTCYADQGYQQEGQGILQVQHSDH
jgi:hypothetical protein